ncbi:hypothetical protein W04_2092 [Pseudoalteromonas sp. SW0106-04]|nr:hypothetical protein W04_2092 [Pseudoalteromonas sp. SW0106-04]
MILACLLVWVQSLAIKKPKQGLGFWGHIYRHRYEQCSK